MTPRYGYLGLALGAAHLVLVSLGAGGVSLRELGLPGRGLEAYGGLSGANSGYGFFAPGVSFQLGARFDVVERDGAVTRASLATGTSHEADIRAGNIIDQFASVEDEEDEEAATGLRRALAASLAGKMFGRHPDAAAVVVRLETFTPVSMEAWRGGERPQWQPLYTAKFVHSAQPEAEPETDESNDG